MLYKMIAFLSFVCLALCGLAQKVTPQQYIENFKSLAISEMKRTGVPAAITLAQGILESECGNSDLVLKSNNHFGIKCKSDWTGPSVSHDDDLRGECFRAYSDAEDSYRDHSDFLKNSPRYAFLFDLPPTDYTGWSAGLKKAGYATNPKYAEILIANIEKYNLNQYTIEGMMVGVSADEYKNLPKQVWHPEKSIEALPENVSIQFLSVIKVNQLKAVKAPAGSSLLAIATHFKVRLSKLLEWNELEKDGILPQSQLLFLQKKHTEGSEEKITVVKEQSLYDIAQENGLQSATLCRYNNMNKYDQVKPGTTLYLKKNAEVTAVVHYTPDLKTEIVFHTVEPKEGLYTISKKYGISVNQLKEWNGLTNDNLQIGQKLIIAQ